MADQHPWQPGRQGLACATRSGPTRGYRGAHRRALILLWREHTGELFGFIEELPLAGSFLGRCAELAVASEAKLLQQLIDALLLQAHQLLLSADNVLQGLDIIGECIRGAQHASL